MELIWQVVVNGVLSGSIYVLMALGFTLIFGIMKIVNFAHGELYMAGAVTVLVLSEMLHMNYFLAVLVGALLVACLSFAIERLLFRPIAGLELTGMIMSLAVATTLQAVVLIVFGPSELPIERPVTGILRLGSLIVPLDRLMVGGCSLLALAVFYIFIKFTNIGLAMRAVAQDAQAAALMGVVASRTNTLAFVVAGLLAALAGGLMAPIYTVSPFIGDLPMLKAFVVVILGGLGSVPGALLGGMVIAMVESFFGTMFSTGTALIASFGIALTIIVVRPQGFLGKVAS